MLKKIFKEYLNWNGAIDETIIILTLTFLFNIIIISYYVFFLKENIPAGTVSILEYMYPVSAISYGIKGAMKIVEIIKPSVKPNLDNNP